MELRTTCLICQSKLVNIDVDGHESISSGLVCPKHSNSKDKSHCFEYYFDDSNDLSDTNLVFRLDGRTVLLNISHLAKQVTIGYCDGLLEEQEYQMEMFHQAPGVIDEKELLAYYQKWCKVPKKEKKLPKGKTLIGNGLKVKVKTNEKANSRRKASPKRSQRKG